jgi:carbamoyl-phosphate synthase large subunit
VTVDAPMRRRIEETAFTVAAKLGVTGCLHMKAAVAPDGGHVRVLSVNPWYSRMSAFCAKAFGIDLAAIHAGLCLGAGLQELLDSEGRHIARITDGETVAVRLPRWEFNRFAGEDARLDARMKSTGAVMGLGRNLSEAIQRPCTVDLQSIRCRA